MLDVKQRSFVEEGGRSVQNTLKDLPEPASKMRRTHFPEETDICLACGSLFTPRRAWQRYCSTPCRRQNDRKDIRDLVLREIIETALALGYTGGVSSEDGSYLKVTMRDPMSGFVVVTEFYTFPRILRKKCAAQQIMYVTACTGRY